MRAVVMRGANTLVVDDVPDPVPRANQILVRTLACGICGSDLHFLRCAEEIVELSRDLGPWGSLDLSRDIIMGHEFSAEVVGVGPGTDTALRPGDVVVSVPLMPADAASRGRTEPIGAYSNRWGGGFAELMLLSSLLAIRVPDGLDPRRAALTEPMAVGVHAVRRSGIAAGEAAVVLGAGPVGLATVAALRRLGAEPIVAADLSPARRALALTMGAHEAVDPRTEPAVEAWRRLGGGRPLVIFEAVGVPGMLAQAIRDAPRHGRVLVVGACLEQDTVRPFIAVAKELDVRFSFGYGPREFADTLRAIAEGTFDVAPMITGEVGIDGVPAAFEALSTPGEHCKILVDPSRGRS
jgi:threonine dehydrogenase-like Zn-dependent dehydrogenase